MLLRAQVILHTTDALAANYVTNSWAMETVSPASTPDLAEYTAAIKDFYDDLAGVIGVPLAQNGHEVKYYDLEITTPPNYPYGLGAFNLASSPSGSGLPSEVAMCLSFQGIKASGFPQSRRRGRVYIGPLSTTINSTGRPSSGARSQLASAAVTFCSNLKAAANPAVLGVWSHVDSALIIVDNGWVDDSFDTQRRRGVQPTSRTTWVAP